MTYLLKNIYKDAIASSAILTIPPSKNVLIEIRKILIKSRDFGYFSIKIESFCTEAPNTKNTKIIYKKALLPALIKVSLSCTANLGHPRSTPSNALQITLQKRAEIIPEDII
jgi:hypothetical protein